jgi:hypothetical protein
VCLFSQLIIVFSKVVGVMFRKETLKSSPTQLSSATNREMSKIPSSKEMNKQRKLLTSNVRQHASIIRQEKDTRRAAEAASKSSQQSDERDGQRTSKVGTTREETHYRH